MIFLNNESRTVSKQLANEFGVDFEQHGYTATGGLPPKESAQGAFKTNNVAWSKSMFEPLERVFTKLDRPILFEDGIGAVLDTNENNKHVFPILRGDTGVYSRHHTETGKKATGLVSGEQMTLVAGYQSTYNLRVVLSGSLKMCSNQAMLANRDPTQGNTLSSSPNYVLCTEMVEWNLQERGVLRANNVRHHKVGD